MAVIDRTVNGAILLSGNPAPFETIATVDFSSVPPRTAFIVDVILFGALGTFLGESSVVARYISLYKTDGSGSAAQIGTTQILTEYTQVSGGAYYDYRQQISGSTIQIQVEGLAAPTFIYDIRSIAI